MQNLVDTPYTAIAFYNGEMLHLSLPGGFMKGDSLREMAERGLPFKIADEVVRIKPGLILADLRYSEINRNPAGVSQLGVYEVDYFETQNSDPKPVVSKTVFGPEPHVPFVVEPMAHANQDRRKKFAPKELSANEVKIQIEKQLKNMFFNQEIGDLEVYQLEKDGWETKFDLLAKQACKLFGVSKDGERAFASGFQAGTLDMDNRVFPEGRGTSRNTAVFNPKGSMSLGKIGFKHNGAEGEVDYWVRRMDKGRFEVYLTANNLSEIEKVLRLAGRGIGVYESRAKT